MQTAQATHLQKKVSIPLFFAATLGTLGLGTLSGLLSGANKGYSGLVLPPATPPNAVFPVVWSVLYVMIGLSLFFILRRPAVTELMAHNRRTAAVLWTVSLCFNLAWPFAFFALELYAFSFLWLAALAALNLATIIYAFRISPTAAALLIPYEAWLLFAGYLNLFIAILN